jgi:hypothetical protein
MAKSVKFVTRVSRPSASERRQTLVRSTVL